MLLILNILTIGSNVSNVISISAQKRALDYTYIAGNYSLLERRGVVKLGYNESTNQSGLGVIVYELNGYPFIYIPKWIPVKVYLLINAVYLPSVVSNCSTITVKINDYQFQVNVSSGTRAVEVPRGCIKDGVVKVFIQVQNNTVIYLKGIKLVGIVPNKPDLINIEYVIFFTILFVIVVSVVALILLREIRKSEVGDLLYFSVLVSIIISSLTHDIWDFTLWQRFSYYTFIFNSPYPSTLWADNPLWAYIVVIFSSPYFLLWRFYHQYVSLIILNIFIKIPLILSYTSVAIILEKLLKNIFKRSVNDIKAIAYLWLFNPFILWQLMWGQRDLLAVALAILGIYLILNNRIFLGSFIMMVASTIKSYVLLWVFVVFLYLLYKSDHKITVLKYLMPWTLYPMTWLLLPSDLIKAIFLYRSGLKRYILIQGYTWLFSLSRFIELKDIVKILFPIGMMLCLFYAMLEFYNSVSSIRMLRMLLIISIIFYLTYYSINPQFLILILPVILIDNLELGIIYSIFGILYLYAHFQDYRAFVSPLVIPRKGYDFLFGSSVDIALSLIFSLFLLFVLLRTLKENCQTLNIKFDWLRAVGFILVFFLPYCIEVGKNVGTLTLITIILYLCIWLAIFEEKFRRHTRNRFRPYQTKYFSYFQIINIILWGWIIVVGINYFDYIVFLLILLMLLINLIIFVNNKSVLAVFSPLINIFVALAYGFNSAPGPLFMNLIYPPKDLLIIISVVIAINVLLWIFVIVQNMLVRND